MTKKKVSNVFEAILKYGHDEDFIPEGGDDFLETDAPAGSDEENRHASPTRRIGHAPLARSRS